MTELLLWVDVPPKWRATTRVRDSRAPGCPAAVRAWWDTSRYAPCAVHGPAGKLCQRHRAMAMGGIAPWTKEHLARLLARECRALIARYERDRGPLTSDEAEARLVGVLERLVQQLKT